jgi:hypothetical protein
LNAHVVLIAFNFGAWDKASTIFIGFWGFKTIDYFELTSLVEGPFPAKFNQCDSSHLSKGLSPTINVRENSSNIAGNDRRKQ